MAQLILGCQKTALPISYLGMPLTLKKPARQDFAPLIERLEKRLEGWQTKIISRGGRLQLINSVLTTIPIYFMACFSFLRWLLDRIGQLCQNFLWGRGSGQQRGMSLINLDAVITPKDWGGLGVRNMQIRNCSLLLRWWWRAYKEPDSLWGATVRLIYGINISIKPLIWKVSGSFFWNWLLKTNWSAIWEIGDGCSISFWYDTWAASPLREFRDKLPRSHRHQLSPTEALICPSQIPHTKEMSQIMLVDGQDLLQWRWMAHGRYTAASVYKVMVSEGKLRWGYYEI